MIDNGNRHCSIICILTCMFLILGAFNVPRAPAQDSNIGQEESPTLRELSTQHAELNLQLAKIDLQMAELFNEETSKALPGLVDKTIREQIIKTKMIPTSWLERLKSNIAIAEATLNHAKSGTTGRPKSVQKLYQKEKARVAKLRLQEIQDREPRKSGLARELEIERLRLISEIAKLQIEMPDQPEYLIERVDVLQWQIDKLGDEFRSLEQRLVTIEDRLKLHKR